MPGTHNQVSIPTLQRTVALTLPPVAESAGRARAAVTRAGVDADLQHTVALLTSEIVSNSVRHAPETPEVRLEAVLRESFVRVEISDQGEGFDPDVRHEANGFGLRLVDKLASRWGVECDDETTTVWFEVDRRRRRFDRDRD